MHFDQHVSLLWSAHIELKKCLWYFYFNIWLFFNHFLNFKVVLLNKVFIVDAISQEKRKKSKIQDILLGFITYTSNIIFKFHEKPTEYQPRINYWEKGRLFCNHIEASPLTLFCLSALLHAREQRPNTICKELCREG